MPSAPGAAWQTGFPFPPRGRSPGRRIAFPAGPGFGPHSSGWGVEGLDASKYTRQAVNQVPEGKRERLTDRNARIQQCSWELALHLHRWMTLLLGGQVGCRGQSPLAGQCLGGGGEGGTSPGLERVGREGYHPSPGRLVGSQGKGGAPLPRCLPGCGGTEAVNLRPRPLSFVAEPLPPVPGGGVEGRAAGFGNLESTVPWRPDVN